MNIWTPSELWRHNETLERRLSERLDPEAECWRAARHRWVADGGRVRKVRSVGGASFLTGSQAETLYTNIVSGTAKNTFTTEAVINDTAALGAQPILPAYFWLPGPEGPGHGTLRIIGRGILSTTSAPTFTWAVRLGGAASTAGPLIGGTAALTAATTVTNKGWEIEFDAILRTSGAEGGNSTILGAGMITSFAGLASPFGAEVWGGAAQPGTVATVDVSITNHINFNAACGTSSSSNGLTLLQLIVMGLN